MSRIAPRGHLAGVMLSTLLVAMIGLAAMTFATRYLVRDAVRSQVEGEIDSDIAGLLRDVPRFRIVAMIDGVDRRVMGVTGAHDPAIYAVRFGGRLVAGNLPAWPVQASPPSGKSFLFARASDREGTLISAKIVRPPGGVELLVGRQMRAYHRFERRLAPLLAVTVAGIVAACSLLLLWHAARISRRIGRVNEVLSAAAHGDYSRRVGRSPVGHDELAVLAHGVDDMLERSEVLVENLRRLAERVAHELKRPVADMLRLVRGRDMERETEVEEALVDLLALFDALLELSEVSSGTGLPLAPLDLAEVARDACGLYGDGDPARGVRLLCRVDAPAPMVGERWLLLRAVCNLVDNALRHSPEGGAVTVAVAASSRTVTLSISDEGAGFGGRALADVIRAARRAERRAPGSHGLGLRMAEAIALRHGGTIASREQRGLTVTLAFPRAPHGALAEAQDAR